MRKGTIPRYPQTARSGLCKHPRGCRSIGPPRAVGRAPPSGISGRPKLFRYSLLDDYDRPNGASVGPSRITAVRGSSARSGNATRLGLLLACTGLRRKAGWSGRRAARPLVASAGRAHGPEGARKWMAGPVRSWEARDAGLKPVFRM
jgi:hypothetical protein